MFGPGHEEQSGIAKRARILSQGLAARGWDVRVLARSPSSRRFRLARSPNLTVVDVPGFGRDRLATGLFLAVALPFGVTSGHGASVFVGFKLFSPALAAAACARMTRRPFVAMATTSGPRGEVAHLIGDPHVAPTGRGRGWVFRRGMAVRRAMLRPAAFLVGQSPSAAAELAALVPQDRVAVIPSPVAVVQAPPLSGHPRAAFVGRLSRDKDLLGLIRAWSAVVGTHPDARLTLVGGGGRHEPLEQEVRRVIAHDSRLQTTVRLTGWVADVSPFLAEADVFVMPAIGEQEGMSNALLEACSWGRVVVASDIPANRAVLGEDYPLLFPAGDSSALSQALIRALYDVDLRERARAQVAARAKEFSIDRVLDRLEDLLRSVSRQ